MNIFLTDSKINELKKATFELLETTPMKVFAKETIDILVQAGCKADGNAVLFPRKVVEKCLSDAPKQWILYNKHGDACMYMGYGKSYYSNGDVALDFLDWRTHERRPSTIQDIHEAAKVINKLENYSFTHLCGEPIGGGKNYSKDNAAVDAFEAIVPVVDKPMFPIVHSVDQLKRMYDLAAKYVDGYENLINKPFICTLQSSCSPFSFPESSIEQINWLADKRLPYVFNCSISLGTTAPITIPGAMVQCMAELLAGLCITQTRNPGTPVCLGSGLNGFDMKYGKFLFGSPEMVMATQAMVELEKSFGLPVWTSAMAANSSNFDEQMAIETALNTIIPAIVGGADIVFDAGYIESGHITSIELLVLTNEILGMVKRCLRPIEIDSIQLPMDLIKEVAGNNGNYLQEDHTYENFRNELWEPLVSDRRMYEGWKTAGKKTMRQRIDEKIQQLLDED